MINPTVSLTAKWEQYLKGLANDHQVDLNKIVSELCEWAFSNPEGKKQFEEWLADAFPSEGEEEDKEKSASEDTSEAEEEMQDESEEEAHEDRNYNEDTEPTYRHI